MNGKGSGISGQLWMTCCCDSVEPSMLSSVSQDLLWVHSDSVLRTHRFIDLPATQKLRCGNNAGQSVKFRPDGGISDETEKQPKRLGKAIDREAVRYCARSVCRLLCSCSFQR